MALSTVWRLIAHHENRAAAIAWTKQNHRIAIGWDCVGDIGTRGYKNASDIAREIAAAYALGQHPYRNSGAGGASLWGLYDDMQIGDAVILVAHGRELVVKVTGPYEFNPHNISALGNYYHQREVELTDFDPDVLWHVAGATGAKVAKGHSVRSILVPLPKKVDLAEL
ncbi:hypothetical protein IAD21_02223 [Abditibacteriota bacterium]|nr:hypothetical protein IAD21_02223 [Abditibacteriota bacterium]